MAQTNSKRRSSKFNAATIGLHLSTKDGAIAVLETVRAGRIHRGQDTSFEDAQIAALRRAR